MRPSALPEGRKYSGPITNGAWVAARDLKPGQRLLDADGSWTDVVEVRTALKPLLAFNLTVADFHTYFVKQADNDNAEPVWVHNACQYTPTSDGLVSSKGTTYLSVGQTVNGNAVYYSKGNYFAFDGTSIARIDLLQQGLLFETQFLNALGIDKNTLKVVVTLDDGTLAYTIPDGLGRIAGGVLEAKFYTATVVTKSNQIQAQINYAIKQEIPYNLVVGPNTTVDSALKASIENLQDGGNIYRFDPATGLLTAY